MIVKGVLRFLRSLKYYFIPAGALLVGIVFGLSLVLPGVANILSDTVGGLSALLSESVVSNEQLLQALSARVAQLDWNDPLHALSCLLSEKWLTETMEECVRPFVEDYDAYAARLGELAQEAADGLWLLVVGFLSWTAVGLAAGFVVLGRLVNENATGCGTLRHLFSVIVKGVLGTAMLFACTALASLVFAGGAVLLLAELFALTAASLLSAFFVYGKGKLRLKEVLNLKNCLCLLAGDACIFAVCAALVSLVWAATSPLAALVLALPLLEIGFFAADANAEGYVRECAQKRERNG